MMLKVVVKLANHNVCPLATVSHQRRWLLGIAGIVYL